jgi:hypothetical protein
LALQADGIPGQPQIGVVIAPRSARPAIKPPHQRVQLPAVVEADLQVRLNPLIAAPDQADLKVGLYELLHHKSQMITNRKSQITNHKLIHESRFTTHESGMIYPGVGRK